MKFSVSDLLDQLRGESVLPVEDLEKKLALRSAADKAQLAVALQALEKVGILQSAETGVSRAANEGVAKTFTSATTNSTTLGTVIGCW